MVGGKTLQRDFSRRTTERFGAIDFFLFFFIIITWSHRLEGEGKDPAKRRRNRNSTSLLCNRRVPLATACPRARWPSKPTRPGAPRVAPRESNGRPRWARPQDVRVAHGSSNSTGAQQTASRPSHACICACTARTPDRNKAADPTGAARTIRGPREQDPLSGAVQ